MILNFIAYFLIPGYTILFVRGTNWFTLNFSVIGSWSGRKNAFLLWGVIVGAYFYFTLRKIIRYLPLERKENAFLNTCLLLLSLAVTTPYLPQDLPFQSFLHVIFAFTASVLLLLTLYLTVIKLYHINHEAYRPYLACLHVITIICTFLLFLAGIVSSALEIFFTISSVVMVRMLYKKVSALNSSLTRPQSASQPPFLW